MLGTLGKTVVIDAIHEDCSTPGCGHPALIGAKTSDNDVRWLCKSCTKPYFDTLL